MISMNKIYYTVILLIAIIPFSLFASPKRNATMQLWEFQSLLRLKASGTEGGQRFNVEMAAKFAGIMLATKLDEHAEHCLVILSCIESQSPDASGTAKDIFISHYLEKKESLDAVKKDKSNEEIATKAGDHNDKKFEYYKSFDLAKLDMALTEVLGAAFTAATHPSVKAFCKNIGLEQQWGDLIPLLSEYQPKREPPRFTVERFDDKTLVVHGTNLVDLITQAAAKSDPKDPMSLFNTFAGMAVPAKLPKPK